jgi:hypothetical protein
VVNHGFEATSICIDGGGVIASGVAQLPAFVDRQLLPFLQVKLDTNAVELVAHRSRDQIEARLITCHGEVKLVSSALHVKQTIAPVEEV